MRIAWIRVRGLMMWSPLFLAFILTDHGSPAMASEPGDSFALGINLAGVRDWSTEMPFVDLFLRAREWVPQQEGKPWGQGPPLARTAEGWVARLEDGQYATTILSGGGHPPGRYTCTYRGKGQLRFWGDVAELTTPAPGRVEFTSKGKDNIFLDIRATDRANPIRDIKVVMPGFETAAGENPFHPHFLARTGRFRVIRFMDWMETNGSEVKRCSDRPTPSDFSQAIKGVSLEYMIDLCNRLKVDPWFCIPHLADDDFVRQFATMVKERLDPKLKVYVEHSNEVWNGQFAQARFAKEEGRRLGLSDNDFQAQLNYHSMRSVQIFQIFEQVFGGNERLVRVMGSQSANPWVSEQVLGFREASKQTDALAIAPYFGHGLGSPGTADEVARMPVEQVLERCRQDIERNQKTIEETVAKARALGLPVIAYEAGQHLVGIQGAENNEALMEKLHAANRHPGMKELYIQYIKGWQDAGGGLMAIFSSVGAYSKWGSWGILETEFQEPATAPKYEAVLEYLGKR